MVDYCVEVVEKMLCLVLKLLNVLYHQIVNHGNLMLLQYLLFQLVLGFVIVIGLKASFKTGIGHLYGPLFFIAVLRLIPFGYYKEYVQLKFTISIFQSILLLNLVKFHGVSSPILINY